MREIQATKTKTCWDELLDAVGLDEPFAIVSDGKPIAHVVPIPSEFTQEERQAAVQRFKKMRSEWKTFPVTTEEILAWRREGL